mmetsp:Transcript_15672/g.32424  ORF Transcript_15672/g.32424 Transcript_15672/m.32424 type:complete len:694 (-) Transcript_15672:174-2255(-)
MESYMSSLTDSNLGPSSVEVGPVLESLRGRKSIEAETAPDKDTLLEETNPVVSDEDADTTESVDTDTDDDFSSDEESDDEEEEDEEWEERMRILGDAKHLKKVANFFLHPEAPVEVDAFASARCYFDRASASEVEEDHEERTRILEEIKALKRQAVDFMHPERPVVVEDPTLFGRNYFSRASASEQEGEDYMEERMRVLGEAQQLKKVAVDFLHPERPVVAEDPSLFGRNFFGRASAPEQEEDMEERDLLMHDMKQLKKLALDYLHPERPIVVDDPTLYGRNFFGRSSAPEQEDIEMVEERERVLAEVNQLKKAAADFQHPERPVVADPALFGRNFFSRASAHEQEDMELVEERERIMAEAQKLKKLAMDFLHPELPVVAEDPTLFGRNYFNRASAPEQEDMEVLEERELILAEAQKLKQLAVDFLHPELPVVAEDPTLFGRNYFNRASAPDTEDLALAQERERVLSEAKALKDQAVAYLHPERPVVCEDPTLFGRNYFSRASAPEQEDSALAQEREHVLSEAKALKKLAVDYLHPEYPVATEDSTVFGRNYFGRASAPEQEDLALVHERELVLAEGKALKKLAVDYLHPEISVVTSDGAVSGRNFFNRPGAHIHDQMVHTFPAHEDDGHEDHHHMDHFGMDEDVDFMFDDMRDQFVAPTSALVKPDDSGEEGGNLSRSPSSVMLFTGESAYD